LQLVSALLRISNQGNSIVGKKSLAGTSLVAAIPGAVLAYLMLMAVLSSFEPMPAILKVAAILVLVVGATMALFPAYVLIWYGGSSSKAAAAAPVGEDQGPAAEAGFVDDVIDEIEGGEEVSEVEGFDVIDDPPDSGWGEAVFPEEDLGSGPEDAVFPEDELGSESEAAIFDDAGLDAESPGEFDEEFEFEEFEDFDDEK